MPRKIEVQTSRHRTGDTTEDRMTMAAVQIDGVTISVAVDDWNEEGALSLLRGRLQAALDAVDRCVETWGLEKVDR